MSTVRTRARNSIILCAASQNEVWFVYIRFMRRYLPHACLLIVGDGGPGGCGGGGSLSILGAPRNLSWEPVPQPPNRRWHVRAADSEHSQRRGPRALVYSGEFSSCVYAACQFQLLVGRCLFLFSSSWLFLVLPSPRPTHAPPPPDARAVYSRRNPRPGRPSCRPLVRRRRQCPIPKSRPTLTPMPPLTPFMSIVRVSS